ncbi:hypothetical protein [Synechococcus elongatus]|uniref:hypothetical protein n=1 Tax=Synechococcus elongatus TaxID=32046 RepID=UPI000F7F29E0|nr:hypothetical protein [Synechococcus elongatus]
MNEILNAIWAALRQVLVALAILAIAGLIVAAVIYGAYISRQDFERCLDQGYSRHYCWNTVYGN